MEFLPIATFELYLRPGPFPFLYRLLSRESARKYYRPDFLANYAQFRTPIPHFLYVETHIVQERLLFLDPYLFRQKCSVPNL